MHNRINKERQKETPGKQIEMEGLLLIDKPSDCTSHDIIDIIRKKGELSRVGHTGTLDPLATGLLVCCLGRATRLAEYLSSADKVYEGEMILGFTSDTFDAQGKLVAGDDPVPQDSALILKAFQTFIGTIMQQPPIYSAVKIQGRRLYDYARSGESVDIPKRNVEVKTLELLEYTLPKVKFVAKVSSGTYIRSICNDVGILLKCGAYLGALRRLEVGPYSVKDALKIEEIQSNPLLIGEKLIPINKALNHLPKVILSNMGLKKFLNGTSLSMSDIAEFLTQKFSPRLPVQVMDRGGRFYGIIERRKKYPKTSHSDTREPVKPIIFYQPVKVIPPE